MFKMPGAWIVFVEIGAEQNTTIVFPLPIDLISSVTQALNGSKKIEALAGSG